MLGARQTQSVVFMCVTKTAKRASAKWIQICVLLRPYKKSFRTRMQGLHITVHGFTQAAALSPFQASRCNLLLRCRFLTDEQRTATLDHLQTKHRHRVWR